MEKRKYNTWTPGDMEKALDMYNKGKLGFNATCRTYGIPKPTFRRHLKKLNVNNRIGRPNDLTTEMEEELVRHVLELESNFFGLRIQDLRRLAFQLAEKYKLPHRFNKDAKCAGWKWYYNFLKKHQEITLRTPEPTSMARCKGFNKETVMSFFDKYEALLDEGKFAGHQIFNVDETGLSTVHKPSKILAQKGKRQVGAVTSGERGVNTTCICCMNAVGEFIPPMLIFKRKRMTEDLKRGGPPNTVYSCSDSGWITSELFLEWLTHFIKCTKLEKGQRNQILLIMDGHSTHTKNIDAINLARDYGIVMLSLPPHTTHKLQPLDVSFFKPLKNRFNAAGEAWMRNHPDSVIKQANIAEILGVAYPRAVCMETAMNGFEACGLWPCNRYKIREDEYVTLAEDCRSPELGTVLTSEKPVSFIVNPCNSIEKLIPSTTTQICATLKPAPLPLISINNQIPIIEVPGPSISTHIAGPSSSSENIVDCYLDQIIDNRDQSLSPSILEMSAVEFVDNEDQLNIAVDSDINNKENLSNEKIRLDIQNISPMATLTQSKKKIRKTTVSQVLTESPYKTELENKLKVKIKKLNLNPQKVTKRKSDTNGNRNSRKKKKEDAATWYCKICQENRQEDMIQCTECDTWIHELCAGVDKNTVDYLCDDCKTLQKNIDLACKV